MCKPGMLKQWWHRTKHWLGLPFIGTVTSWTDEDRRTWVAYECMECEKFFGITETTHLFEIYKDQYPSYK